MGEIWDIRIYVYGQDQTFEQKRCTDLAHMVGTCHQCNAQLVNNHTSHIK